MNDLHCNRRCAGVTFYKQLVLQRGNAKLLVLSRDNTKKLVLSRGNTKQLVFLRDNNKFRCYKMIELNYCIYRVITPRILGYGINLGGAARRNSRSRLVLELQEPPYWDLQYYWGLGTSNKSVKGTGATSDGHASYSTAGAW